MGFTAELVKPAATRGKKARGRRKDEAGPQDEVLDALFEDGEIWRAVRRFGPDRFPTLFRLDSHSSHVFDAYWAGLTLAEIERIEGLELTRAEAGIFASLRGMGQACLLDKSLVMRFTGD
ncbi:hypothetical protein [Kitasatospora sp. KL5]|uniref:hypothetical protein n=1 Tax=Kitasatospora sp. KL5 TaxID=3425125 RepID=UPI003D6F3006